jgi:hypothetical protein
LVLCQGHVDTEAVFSNWEKTFLVPAAFSNIIAFPTACLPVQRDLVACLLGAAVGTVSLSAEVAPLDFSELWVDIFIYAKVIGFVGD